MENNGSKVAKPIEKNKMKETCFWITYCDTDTLSLLISVVWC